MNQNGYPKRKMKKGLSLTEDGRFWMVNLLTTGSTIKQYLKYMYM